MRYRLLIALSTAERPARYRAVVLAANEFGVELTPWRGPYRETAAEARGDGAAYIERQERGEAA